MDLNINPFDIFKYAWMIISSKAFLGLVLLLVLFTLPRRILELIVRQREELRDREFRHKCRVTGVDATDTMNGRQFEKWLAVKFEKLGYQVHLKSGTKDQGADLILRTKSGERICVQAKKRGKQNIGVAALGDLVRGMRYYETPRGIVVTNQHFTRDMIEEASYYPDIELWDRERLVSELAKVEGLTKKKR